MRRVARDSSGSLRRSARGVAFLWTIVIAMPLMFFGLSMAVDFTRIILANREVSAATYAAALAGAYEFNSGQDTINLTRASAAARETLCVSFQQGAVKDAVPGERARAACAGGGSIAASVRLPTESSVEVTSSYRVDGLLLMKYFGYSEEDTVIRRTAAVCNPSDPSGPTAGYCTRPQD